MEVLQLICVILPSRLAVDLCNSFECILMGAIQLHTKTTHTHIYKEDNELYLHFNHLKLALLSLNTLCYKHEKEMNLLLLADFQGMMGDISPGPQKNCQLKPPPKVKLGGPMPKGNNEIPRAQK
jgi:hypothetical protein